MNRILIVGTHKGQHQPSMALWADWVERAFADISKITHTCAPSVFLNQKTKGRPLSKWLFYIDQFVIFPLILAIRHLSADIVFVADHANLPSCVFVPRRKLRAMMHDTIAFRQARDEIAEAPPVPATGRLLQKIVLRALQRVPVLAVNTDKVARELEARGVRGEMIPAGCPLDTQRFQRSERPPGFPDGPYVMNVAGDSWRKRKHALLEIWEEYLKLRPTGLKLVLAGFSTEETKRLAEKYGASIVFIRPTDAQLAWLYANCEATIVPSVEEGFCIPILESIYFGKPVFGASGADYESIFPGCIWSIPRSSPAEAAAVMSARLGTPPDRRAFEAALARYAFDEFAARLRSTLPASLHPEAAGGRAPPEAATAGAR